MLALRRGERGRAAGHPGRSGGRDRRYLTAAIKVLTRQRCYRQAWSWRSPCLERLRQPAVEVDPDVRLALRERAPMPRRSRCSLKPAAPAARPASSAAAVSLALSTGPRGCKLAIIPMKKGDLGVPTSSFRPTASRATRQATYRLEQLIIEHKIKPSRSGNGTASERLSFVRRPRQRTDMAASVKVVGSKQAGAIWYSTSEVSRQGVPTHGDPTVRRAGLKSTPATGSLAELSEDRSKSMIQPVPPAMCISRR